MDETEHTRLLYLVDALSSAPGKSSKLLSMAAEPGSSERYQKTIERLKQASSPQLLLAETAKIREELK